MSLQITKPKNIIDLGVGQPDPSLLPASLFQPLAFHRQDLGYGEEAGASSFRQTLADWLSMDYNQPITADQLMITNGSSNALDMICAQFAEPGATVLVEDPTYFIALNFFAERGIHAVAIPMDDDGIQLDALESALQQHQPAFIYTIPSYHNPTGITQPHERRGALVALAKKHQCLLVADEVYQSLYYQKKPPPPLACYDNDAPVLSVGTFSKILAPGLRLGWIQGTGAPIKKLLKSALLKSGGGLAPVTSALVEPLIANGDFHAYLMELRQTYKTRLDTLYDGLKKHMGDNLQMTKPEGGYFLWATLTSGSDVANKLAAAKNEGVNFLGGTLFSANEGYTSSMRLCFAWYAEEELEIACERLAQLFKNQELHIV